MEEDLPFGFKFLRCTADVIYVGIVFLDTKPFQRFSSFNDEYKIICKTILYKFYTKILSLGLYKLDSRLNRALEVSKTAQFS